MLSRISSLPTIVCDRDHVIAAAGVSKREFLGSGRVTRACLRAYATAGVTLSVAQSEAGEVISVEGIDRAGPAVILSDYRGGRRETGAAVMLKNENKTLPTETEVSFRAERGGVPRQADGG